MIDIKKILDANEVLAGVVRETPVLSSKTVNSEMGVNLYLKAECNQINGSFKSRGAYFAMHQYLQKNEKKTIILVEQNAKKGLEFADIGYVLVSGQTAIAGKGDDLLKNPDVGRLFLGG